MIVVLSVLVVEAALELQEMPLPLHLRQQATRYDNLVSTKPCNLCVLALENLLLGFTNQ